MHQIITNLNDDIRSIFSWNILPDITVDIIEAQIEFKIQAPSNIHCAGIRPGFAVHPTVKHTISSHFGHHVSTLKKEQLIHIRHVK